MGHKNNSIPRINIDLKKIQIQYIYRNKSIQKNHKKLVDRINISVSSKLNNFFSIFFN